MQQLLEAEQNTDTNAAQVRVTPQELVQATAAIEARHHARAQQDAATIPIGEAVHQLNLDATPEEVLAEVQAQRNAKTQTQQSAAKRNLRPRAVKIMAAVIAAQLAIIALLGMQFVKTNRLINRLRDQVSDYASLQAMSTAPQLHNVTPQPAAHAINIQLLHSDKVRTLDIGTDQTIRCKYNIIETLLVNSDFAHIYTAKNPVGTTWELVRAGDHFNVKCWTSLEGAQQLLNGQSAIVYATKAGAFDEHPDTQISLPVEAFRDASVHATTDAPAAIGVNGTR